MAEPRNISIGEANKLEGVSNYHVWSLRMRALFRRERLWEITSNRIDPTAFPTVVGGVNVAGQHALDEMKASAMSALIASVKDDIVDMIAEHLDPFDAWNTLRDTYQSQDASNLLMYQSQLHSMRMFEGGVMEEYLMSVRELKNSLATLGDPVPDRTLVQMVLNGLPRSYEFVIPSLTNAPMFPTFEIVCSKLITEYYRL